MADGLQVLRYNVSTAYKSHLDYLDMTPTSEHDFDSSRVGTNRFATILLYMSDFEPADGGETVFSYGEPYKPVKTPPTYLEALEEARAHSSLFKPNSWEEKMVAECRSQVRMGGKLESRTTPNQPTNTRNSFVLQSRFSHRRSSQCLQSVPDLSSFTPSIPTGGSTSAANTEAVPY